MKKKVTTIPTLDMQTHEFLIDEINSKDGLTHLDELIEIIEEKNPVIADFVVKHCSRIDEYSTSMYAVLLLYRSLDLSGELPEVTKDSTYKVVKEIECQGLDNFITSSMNWIEEKDPMMSYFIEEFCDKTDYPKVATYTALIMYRALEVQAKENQDSYKNRK